MRKYQHIIWDWNGTLLNDVDICVEVLNELLQTHTEEIYNLPEYKSAFGFPILDYYTRVGFDFEKESFPDLCNRFMKLYHERLPLCDLHENTKMTLATFQQNGLNQHILSASEHASLMQRVLDFELEKHFDYVMGLENNHAASKVGNGKLLAEQLGTNLESLLFIGDTLHDKQVADAMGIDSVLLAHGHQEKTRLEASGTTVLDSLEELVLLVL